MRFLIDRKITITMIFIALTFLGYVSYKQLKLELIPSVEMPMMSVQISSDKEVDPSFVESEVIVPLEGVIAKVGGVQECKSMATTNGGYISVEFKNGVDIKSTSIKFAEEINAAAKKLPTSFKVNIQNANISNTNNNNFMTLSVKGEGSVDQIRAVTEKDLKNKLENIDGIVSVDIYGGKQRTVNIELQPELCNALRVTSETVSQALSSAGGDRTFLGYADNLSERRSIFIEGGYDDVELLGNVVVADGPVFLKDVAIISSEFKEPTTISRVDGQRAISVKLVNESGINIIELSDRTKTEIEQLNEAFAVNGISIVVESNNAEEIETNIDQIRELGIIGALLAIIILWFFLHNLRLVLFIALAIPISVFAAFNMFYALGITINSLTLIGIALAVGMLLDNSIVVLENIYRLYMNGRTASQAVIEGTRQVWRSIIAATLTTITVFLPFIFTDNIVIALVGRNLGIAIIATLFFSLLVALLFIPMTTYLILRIGKGKSRFSDKISIHERVIQIYTIVLKSVLRRPAVVITSTMVLLFVAFVWAMTQGEGQSKIVNSDRINIAVTMPPGSTIASSDKMITLLESKLDSLPERKELRSMVQENNATLTLKLKDDFDKNGGRNMGEIISDVTNRLRTDNLVINVSSGMEGGDGFGSIGNGMMEAFGVGNKPNKIVLRGSDYQTMIRVADDLSKRMGNLDFIGNTYVSVQPPADQIALGFDQITMNALGISRSQISEGLNGMSVEQNSGTKMKFGDELIDITITNEKKDTSLLNANVIKTKNLTDLKQTQIKSNNGALYQLDHVASVSKIKGKGNINRVDRTRELNIFYNYKQRDIPDDVKSGYDNDINQAISEYPMPSGIGAEIDNKDDSLDEFKFLIVASLILIFMILASVFESLSTPFVLLFAIPLAAIGSLVALILSNNQLYNINTLTGFIILLGVVVNGGIILIDYINILRKRGYSRSRAVLSSGASRLRPIMITTITTIVALLPLALGDQDYAGAIGAPFAITVIGGLAFSSLLTLILIPTLYVSMENIIKWYKELPTWIHLLHITILLSVSIYIFTSVEGIFIRIVYMIFLVSLTPALTYLIRTSVRVANSGLIPENEPITITARNLVKIYDRPGRLQREWQGAKKLRNRLGLDSECKSLSDLKDLLWKVVIANVCLGLAVLYFINNMWITVMIVFWALLTISMWDKIYRYHVNKRLSKEMEPRRLMRLLSVIFNYSIAVLSLAIFVYSSKIGNNSGIAVFYLFILILGWLANYLARRVERKGINVERINGRFSNFRRSVYKFVLSLPVIGSKRKPFTALKGVSFTIQTGMFGLLGPNGAGKSTFMRIVTGIYEQSYGTIWINDKDTRKYREELQGLIGFLPQEFGTYESMTAWDFLDYQAILKGLNVTKQRHERLEYVFKAVHMYEKKDVRIGSFSGGMKQRIGIALILLNLPRILVVDEPTAGLDPRERIRFRNLLVELSRDRIVIFSTHIIEDIASSCNQVVVINKGELKYQGEPNNMLEFAIDKVWTFSVTEEEFKNLDHTLVANHMRDNDHIRVRYISKEQPVEGAQKEEPTLEDAYLCLLKNM